MRKWEYYTATWKPQGLLGKWQWSGDSMKALGFTEGLDHLGARGWEMCASTVADYEKYNAYEYVFKRPVD